MKSIGKVEKKIYQLREDGPLVIPQLDPQKLSIEETAKMCQKIKDCGVDHMAVGGSLINPSKLQEVIDIAVKDFDFSVVTYITNGSTGFIKGVKGKTAVYWMSVLNSENLFFLRDILIINSSTIKENELEPLPTAYVFDDRGDVKTATWLTRPTLIPRSKPEISLCTALAAQYLGLRFYIMAGGSGSENIPPAAHIKLLSKKTNLFLIPTSGIMTAENAQEMFMSGADAIHVGKLIEQENGIRKLKKMVETAQKFDGKNGWI
jgi:phosphoglycerol geranylgeranyltransferase